MPPRLGEKLEDDRIHMHLLLPLLPPLSGFLAVARTPCLSKTHQLTWHVGKKTQLTWNVDLRSVKGSPEMILGRMRPISAWSASAEDPRSRGCAEHCVRTAAGEGEERGKRV